MSKPFRPPARPAGPMISPMAVQGPDLEDMRPDQLRALQEAQAAESARRAEAELRPKTGTMAARPAGGAGLAIVIAAGGIILLLFLTILLGFLGIRF